MGYLMINNDNIKYRFLFSEKLIIYYLFLNGLIIISSSLFIYLLSNSIISFICAVIISVTIGIMTNYFIFSKSNLILKKNTDTLYYNCLNENEKYQTIMK